VYEPDKFRQFTRQLKVQTRQEPEHVFMLLLLAALAAGVVWAFDLPRVTAWTCYAAIAGLFGRVVWYIYKGR
jgi:hypothetical protein